MTEPDVETRHVPLDVGPVIPELAPKVSLTVLTALLSSMVYFTVSFILEDETKIMTFK